MNGKQLKNSILQWAIQGKLVPQDPNDEPASVLLERIRAEKKRLIKEGKLKKDKNESIIFRGDDNSYYEKFADGTVVCIDDEIPFEIPQNWGWARLGVVFELKSGQDFPPEKYSSNHVGTPYLTGASNLDGDRIIENRWTNAPTVIAPRGCLLLVCKGSGVGKMCYMALPEAHIARQLQAVIPITIGIDVRFAQVVIECRLHEITRRANGVIPGIDREAVLTFLLPIPPSNEQVRILDKVHSLSILADRFGEHQGKLMKLNEGINTRLKKSILQEAIQGKLVPQDPNDEHASALLYRIKEEKQRMLREGNLKRKDVVDSDIYKGEDNKYYEKVGNKVLDISDEIPFEIPDSWQWVRLGCLFAHNTGKALNRADTSGVLKKYLTTSNVYWNRFDFSEVREMFFSDSEIDKCTVRIGDLLVCEGGDIGRAAIWSFENEICIQNHIHRLRAYYPVSIEFYYYVFELYKGIGHIGGKGIGIQGLSSGAIHNLVFPLPPLQEQKRIVSKIREMNEFL